MTFYDLFVIALKKKGVTAAEIARRTGYHQSYFTNLKKGECRDVTWERALKIIEALGMTPSEFLALGEERDE